MKNELKNMVGQNEKILYEGKPDKRCFIFESIINPLLPFALVWLLVDLFAIKETVGSGEGLGFFIPFFFLHMMPVWIYLVGVIFTFRRYRNTYYIVTDRCVYVSNGIFTKNYHTKPFAELSHVDLHRGIFDRMFNVGDIRLSSNQMTGGNARIQFGSQQVDSQVNSVEIGSIANYMEVYNLVKKYQSAVYTDIMYPNDLRPKENHGYNTEVKDTKKK